MIILRIEFLKVKRMAVEMSVSWRLDFFTMILSVIRRTGLESWSL